ncbi:MAG TPA: peptidyl-prolyl cis-trans isomerase [Steroidobacteraceae bacterium]|nr:peptidyl-prolyl cis-trans isomerase [Steroidobacteraceae bacterium]
MLQSIGDRLKGHRWLAYVVLGPLALIFAAWGAYGIVNLNVGGANYAAEADGSKISLEEARNLWLRRQAEWQQRLGGTDIPAEIRARLQDQVLEDLIRSALIAQRTSKLGYRIGHEELIAAVHNEPAFQIAGQYSADAARDALARAGISPQAFQEDLRRELRSGQLETAIRASDFLTPTEYTRYRNLEDQEREVRYLVVPADKFPGAPVDDAAVEAYYRAHPLEYLTPESVHLQYAELRLATLEAQVTVSDADLHAQYEKVKIRLGAPEKRRARHILITAKDDAAALKEAGDVLAQAKAGKDFAELARKYSKDPGSARNGGELGWAERSAYVKPFADALFGMKVGEIAGPVKTQFGYHIIQLEEIQPAKTKTFDEARPQLETELRRDRATERFGDIQEKLQGALAQGGADLNALAQEFKLQTGDVAQYLKGAGAAPLGAGQPLQDLVFGDPPLAVGHVGGPVLLGNEALALVKVLEHRKPQPKPLAEVRQSIASALAKERGTEAAVKAAEAARARLVAGASFDAVTESFGLKADPAHFVGRNDPSVPAEIRSAVFTAPPPAAAPVYEVVKMSAGGAALFALTRVRTGGPAETPQQQLDREMQQAGRDGASDVMAYVAEVRRTADVRKNPKAFE